MGYASLETVYPNFNSSAVRNPNSYNKDVNKNNSIIKTNRIEPFDTLPTPTQSNGKEHIHVSQCDTCRMEFFLMFNELYDKRKSEQRVNDIIELLMIVFIGWLIVMMIKRLN